MPLPTQGPFPPRPLPRFPGTTGLSATLLARPHSHESPVWCLASPPVGLPMLLPSSSSLRASVTTPAVPKGCLCRSLPPRRRPSPSLRRVGSRIACFEACSTFTRVPARRFAEPLSRGPFFTRVLQTMSLPPCSAWLLPTGATVVGRVSHPLEEGAFPWRTEKCRLFSPRICYNHGYGFSNHSQRSSIRSRHRHGSQSA